MFTFAVLVGIFSYLIFALGLLGLLYENTIIGSTVGFLLFFVYFYKRDLKVSFIKSKAFIFSLKKELLALFLFGLLSLQALVNLIGVLGPELGFDALWYHLSLPKIYLTNHSIFYIPGGLLYYFAMPKLTEMLYLVSLAAGNEIWAKAIHFSFGLLSSAVIYKITRKFTNKTFSLTAVAIFYSSLVVGWQSITAYVDLSRTFFELLGVLFLLNFIDEKRKEWLAKSAVMFGLAIGVKLPSLVSLLIAGFLVFYVLVLKEGVGKAARNTAIFVLTGLGVSLPWLVFALVNTGNPVYPLFDSKIGLGFAYNLPNPMQMLPALWDFFTKAADPVSPLYLIFLPFAFLFFDKLGLSVRVLGWYVFLGLFVWYITQFQGGSRLALPYLAALSILLAVSISKIKEIRFRALAFGLVVLVFLSSIIYRAAANAKYLPVLLGVKTKSEFLAENLNFSFGDFYDIDGYLKSNIGPEDKVLIYGIHNLYYVEFPFIHESWAKKGDTFNYILVQGANLPIRFWYWDLVYENKETGVGLFTLDQEWVY